MDKHKELNLLLGIQTEFNFAGEVSKKTRLVSNKESRVQISNPAPINNEKFPNDYPIENAIFLDKEKFKQLNLNCKPIIKNKDKILEFINLNNKTQLMALKNNFIPDPIIEKYSLNFNWIALINTVSSAMVKNRPGRQQHLVIKDKNYNFIYGFISLASPLQSKQINKYFSNKGKVNFTFMNKYLLDINVCVGTGILTSYLTGKLLILCMLSDFTKKLWDKEYNTDLKYIMTTSIYGISSIYNRIQGLQYLGLSMGWNVIFSPEQLNWIKEEHKRIYPHHQIIKTAKAPHIFRKWNQIWRKYHNEMPFFPYKTQRGTYLFDSEKIPFKTLEENINYWKERWYFPRKQRIEKGEVKI